MKVFLIGLLTLGSMSSFSKEVEIKGNEARKLMNAITSEESSELLQNTLGTTTWKNQNITCTMLGSHSNSMKLNESEVSCTIELGKE